MNNKKGIESFVENLNIVKKIKFDKLVIEYSNRYGDKNKNMIKIMAYNEVMLK